MFLSGFSFHSSISSVISIKWYSLSHWIVVAMGKNSIEMWEWETFQARLRVTARVDKHQAHRSKSKKKTQKWRWERRDRKKSWPNRRERQKTVKFSYYAHRHTHTHKRCHTMVRISVIIRDAWLQVTQIFDFNSDIFVRCQINAALIDTPIDTSIDSNLAIRFDLIWSHQFSA